MEEIARERESERERERWARAMQSGTLESQVPGSLECNSCDKPANLACMALD